MKMREILGNLRATKGMKTLRTPGQLKWNICPDKYQGDQRNSVSSSAMQGIGRKTDHPKTGVGFKAKF